MMSEGESVSDDLRWDYETLGLEPGASRSAVKGRYRALAKESHPDRFEHDPNARAQASERMRKINEAYERLREPMRNAQPVPLRHPSPSTASHGWDSPRSVNIGPGNPAEFLLSLPSHLGALFGLLSLAVALAVVIVGVFQGGLGFLQRYWDTCLEIALVLGGFMAYFRRIRARGKEP